VVYGAAYKMDQVTVALFKEAKIQLRELKNPLVTVVPKFHPERAMAKKKPRTASKTAAPSGRKPASGKRA
jgi:hypothetical protein